MGIVYSRETGDLDQDFSGHTVGPVFVQLFSADDESKVQILQQSLGSGVMDSAFVPLDPRAHWRKSDNVKIAVREGRMSNDPNLTGPF